MFVHRIGWKTLSIGVSGIVVMAGLLFSATPASAQSTWAQAVEVTAPADAATNPGAGLNAVSCSSAGNCTATGSYTDNAGHAHAIAATETAGTWAQATQVTNPGNAVNSFPGATLSGVSCSSFGNCSAVGSYIDGTGSDQAMAATETSGTWAHAVEVTAAADAQAVPTAYLRGISCSSVGNCTASGSYVDSSGHRQAMAATETSGTWAQAVKVTAPANAQANPNAFFGGVSCTSVGNCTASGSFTDSSGHSQAMAAVETSGAWAQATEVTAPANSQANPNAGLSAISCSSVGNCTATGNYIDNTPFPQALAATETSGTWAQATQIAAPANAGIFLPGESLSGVSCSSAGNCTAAGGYVDSSSNRQAMVVTQTSGTWAQPTEVTAPANAGANPAAGLGGGISCPSVGNCTATGSYTDSSAKQQAMAASAPAAPKGYWLVASDGGIFSYGDAQFYGSTGNIHLNKPVVGMAATPDGKGYWFVASDGGIFNYGDAGFFGSAGNLVLNKPVVGMAATPDGKGYWLVASDGGIFSYGDALFYGSTGNIVLNKPVVGMAASPDGKGYWFVAADGGIFNYGSAGFFGSAGNLVLNKPVVGMAATPDGMGYWLVASDGGIFSYGSTQFFGSTGNIRLNKPVVGMAASPTGRGYWFVASDGGIFNYGDAGFFGSAGNLTLNQPVVGMAATA